MADECLHCRGAGIVFICDEWERSGGECCQPRTQRIGCPGKTQECLHQLADVPTLCYLAQGNYMERAMTDSNGRKQVALHPDDLFRMQRLSEEVSGRLKEMGMIVARTLGMPVDTGTIFKFEPRPSGALYGYPGGQHIQLVCSPDGVCGCYIDPPGICVQGNPDTGC